MTTSKDTIKSGHLALTARGTSWLEQFDLDDREIARDFLSALTLVSHNEFERSLTELIVRQAAEFDGPIALFATREIDPTASYFSQQEETINAVGGGSDLGSEARIAALIRNLCKTKPNQYLNHPTIQQMRTVKCRGLFAVDDFIGSGQRTLSFLNSMWRHATLRAWHSLGLISLNTIAYSATEKGKLAVERLTSNPKVWIERECPTFYEMPWPRAKRQVMLRFIEKYGRTTSRRNSPLGFRSTAASIVFEHGCPNNCPAILWAPTTTRRPWLPLFPERSVLFTEASSFPPEIVRRDPVLVMIEAGQRQLASSESLSGQWAISRNALIVMALAAKGIRSRAALAHATGLSSLACGQLLERCVQSRLLTATLRITESGIAELNQARKSKILPDAVPSRGSDSYYPQKLRRPVDG